MSGNGDRVAGAGADNCQLPLKTVTHVLREPEVNLSTDTSRPSAPKKPAEVAPETINMDLANMPATLQASQPQLYVSIMWCYVQLVPSQKNALLNSSSLSH